RRMGAPDGLGGPGPGEYEVHRMRKGMGLPVIVSGLLLLAACQGGGGASGGADASGGGAGQSAGGSGAATAQCIGEENVILSGWQASPEEGELLEEAFAGFEAACPNITIDYQPISGDYPQAMLSNFSAATPPDVFY